MSETDLKKLKRAEILEIMVEQSKSVAHLRDELEHSELISKELAGMVRERDALIEKLKGRLDQKDARIADYEAQIKSYSDQVETALNKKNERIKELETALNAGQRTVAQAQTLEEASAILKNYLDLAQKASEEYAVLAKHITGGKE